MILGDGAAYVAQISPCKDVILVDACARAGIAPELDAIEFHQNARRCLTPEGVFVLNVCGHPYGESAHMLRVRQVFGDALLTLPVRPDGNVIVLGFKERCPEVRAEHLEGRALDLKKRFGVDFPGYVSRMALDLQLRRWEHALR